MKDWGERFTADKAEGTVLVIFVPSVDWQEEPIDQEFWESEALAVLGQLFGGATAFPQGRGVWRDDEHGGRLVFVEVDMDRKIEDLAKKLEAEVVGTVPDTSAGAFGVAKLAQVLRERLEPSSGKRPGRPSNPNWSKRSKVPLAAETEERLELLARLLSDEHRKVSPMQVAAQLLEEATARYFAHTTQAVRRRPSRS